MLPESTQQVIKENRIVIGNGSFSILSSKVVAIPMNVMILLFHHFHNKDRAEAGNIFYITGKLQAMLSFEKQLAINNQKKNIQSLDYLLKLPELYGYGKIILKKFDHENKKVLFEFKSSTFSKQYVKLFGFQKDQIDFFINGYCAGISQVFTGQNMEAVERTCFARKTGPCEILSSPAIDKNNISELYNNLMKKNEIVDEKLIEQTTAVKKFIGHEQFKFQDGWYLLINIPGLIFDVDIFVILIHLLYLEFKDELWEVMYEIGRVQVKQIGNFQIEKFGFDKETFLNVLVQQAEAQGIGIVNIDKIDKKKNTVRCTQIQNNIASKHWELYGIVDYPIDSYICGMINGAVSILLGKDIKGVEENCIAKGDKTCSYRYEEGSNGKNKYNLDFKTIKKNLSFEAMTVSTL